MILKSWLLFLLACNYRGSGDLHIPQMSTVIKDFIPPITGRDSGLSDMQKFLSIDNPENLLRKGIDQENADALYLEGFRYVKGRGKNYKETLSFWERAAAQGHQEAQYSLAMMYLHGQGVERNYREASDHLISAAEQGHAGAQYNLGVLYFEGQGVRHDYQKALKLFERAAAQGHQEAKYSLGMVHLREQGVKHDYRKELHYLIRAAERGEEKAQHFLFEQAVDHWLKYAVDQGLVKSQIEVGLTYIGGMRDKRDYQKALRYLTLAREQGSARAQYYLFEEAAAQGHQEAQYTLGMMYLYGQGVRQDSREAFHWFKRAADRELVEAQIEVGLAYSKGQGVEPDYLGALHYFSCALERGGVKAQHYLFDQVARQKNTNAQYILGGMYLYGQGVRQDSREAFHWFERAADQGLAAAQFEVGFAYFYGQGVETDYQKALYYLSSAAKQEDTDAQYILGGMYLYGQGVRQDFREAFHWFKRRLAAAFEVIAYLPERVLFNRPILDISYYKTGKIHFIEKLLEHEKTFKEKQKFTFKEAEFLYFAVPRDYITISPSTLSPHLLYENWERFSTPGFADFDSTVKISYDKEVFYLTKIAADSGDNDAQYNVAWLYKYGIGVRKNCSMAALYYRQAAEQGHLDASYNLAWMNKKGLGANPNNEQSLYWFNFALNQNRSMTKEITLEGSSISIKSLLDYQRTGAETLEDDVIISVEQFLYIFGKKLREETQSLNISEVLNPGGLINPKENLITVYLNDPDWMKRIKVKAHLEEKEWLVEIKVYDPDRILMNGTVFVPSLPEEQITLKSGIEFYKATGGTSNVGVYQYKDIKICFKQNPEIPGFDLLAYNVFKNLFPSLSPENIPIPKSAVILMNGQPFLVSKFMEGESFSSILESINKEPRDTQSYTFNLAKFQRLAIFHLLSVPEDCHPRNCLVREVKKSNDHEIILLDNERSFGRPTGNEKEGFYTRLHSVLFCFYEKLSNPIEDDVFEEIIKGEFGIRNLLSLMMQKDTYLSALDELAIEKGNNTLLKIPVNRQTLREMALRFDDFKRWIFLDRYRSLMAIFSDVLPEIAKIYKWQRNYIASTPELVNISECISEVDGGRMWMRSEGSPSCYASSKSYFGDRENFTLTAIEEELDQRLDMDTKDSRLPKLEKKREAFFDQENCTEVVNMKWCEEFWHTKMQQILEEQDFLKG